MKKYKGYYYTTKKGDIAARNNVAPLQYYIWNIRNKEGKSLQSSLENEPGEQQFITKRDAELSAIDSIDDYYD